MVALAALPTSGAKELAEKGQNPLAHARGSERSCVFAVVYGAATVRESVAQAFFPQALKRADAGESNGDIHFLEKRQILAGQLDFSAGRKLTIGNEGRGLQIAVGTGCDRADGGAGFHDQAKFVTSPFHFGHNVADPAGVRDCLVNCFLEFLEQDVDFGCHALSGARGLPRRKHRDFNKSR
jgi:hypothetical protein